VHGQFFKPWSAESAILQLLIQQSASERLILLEGRLRPSLKRATVLVNIDRCRITASPRTRANAAATRPGST